MGLIGRLLGETEPRLPALALWALVHELAADAEDPLGASPGADLRATFDDVELAELTELVRRVAEFGTDESLNLLARLVLCTTRNKALEEPQPFMSREQLEELLP